MILDLENKLSQVQAFRFEDEFVEMVDFESRHAPFVVSIAVEVSFAEPELIVFKYHEEFLVFLDLERVFDELDFLHDQDVILVSKLAYNVYQFAFYSVQVVHRVFH